MKGRGNMTETVQEILREIKRLATKNRRLTEERVLKYARLFVVTEWTRAHPCRRFD
ncbi:hypothetical protein KAU55_00705 [Candidatus Bathyarchaeota archaeon]|nr:hypothetical protein [Candidatus Bathyarchaeota archaeon]